MKTITLKNSMLDSFAKVLNYPMAFSQGRLRTRFAGLITPKIQERENSRVEICEKLSLKDSDGKPILVDNSYQFPEGSNYQDELDILYNENITIDIPNSMRSDIGGLKHMIELSTVPLTASEQFIVEYILAILSGGTPEEQTPTPEDNKDNSEGGVSVLP